MTSEAEQREREARDLRVEISRLNESRKALEGLALVDSAEEYRLGLVEAGIKERPGRLSDLSLEGAKQGGGR